MGRGDLHQEPWKRGLTFFLNTMVFVLRTPAPVPATHLELTNAKEMLPCETIIVKDNYHRT